MSPEAKYDIMVPQLVKMLDKLFVKEQDSRKALLIDDYASYCVEF